MADGDHVALRMGVGGFASVHVLSGSPVYHNKWVVVFTLNCWGVAFY